MGARKKKTMTPHAAPTAQEFTIVLEDLRAQFRVFGEALQGVAERVNRLDEKVDGLDGRLTRLEDTVQRGFVRIDLRFEEIDRRTEIRELQVAVARKVDRDEVVTLVDQALARAR